VRGRIMPILKLKRKRAEKREAVEFERIRQAPEIVWIITPKTII